MQFFRNLQYLRELHLPTFNLIVRLQNKRGNKNAFYSKYRKLLKNAPLTKIMIHVHKLSVWFNELHTPMAIIIADRL